MRDDLNNLSITRESPYSPDAIDLLERLRAELYAMYPDELRGVSFHPDEVAATGAIFLIARADGVSVGCGAIRPHTPGVAEIKRMYVTEAMRGRGIARRLLEELESEAERTGYQSIKLETGLKQPEAIALYESSGYRRVQCYGQYADNSMSVCFEKRLQVCE